MSSKHPDETAARTDERLPADAIVTRALPGVREYQEGDVVTIERLPNGRLAVVARAECGNRRTEVDLLDLIESLRPGLWQKLGHA